MNFFGHCTLFAYAKCPIAIHTNTHIYGYTIYNIMLLLFKIRGTNPPDVPTRSLYTHTLIVHPKTTCVSVCWSWRWYYGRIIYITIRASDTGEQDGLVMRA